MCRVCQDDFLERPPVLPVGRLPAVGGLGQLPRAEKQVINGAVFLVVVPEPSHESFRLLGSRNGQRLPLKWSGDLMYVSRDEG